MKDKKNIQEQELNELLNDLFLESNSPVADESMARFVFQQEYDISVNARKEQELIQKLKQDPSDPGNYLNALIILLALAVAGVGIFVFNQYDERVSDRTIIPSAPNRTENTKLEANEIEKELTITPEERNNTVEHIRSSKAEIVRQTGDQKLKSEDITVYYPPSGVGSKTVATFFKPTEQEVVFYNRMKDKMIEKLWSFEKETYDLVDEGELQYKGNRMTMYPFSWKKHAVTNLEYKVFLTALMKNGKTEAFRTAIVRNETWLNYNDNILATTYFFDPRYNDFPVVNISPEAAQLFCQWLEEEVNHYSLKLNPSSQPMRVRLPYDTEWLFATELGFQPMSDCNGYNTIYDLKEDIVDVNYLKRVRASKKKSKKGQTLPDDLFAVNRYGMQEDQLLQLFEKAFSYTDSVDFSKEDLFGKIAHVSEMVIQKQSGNPLVIGSCWKNKNEYASMLKEFTKASASPFVGFRVVVSQEKTSRRKEDAEKE